MSAAPRLVLVGGGHAHVEVLRQFALERPAAALIVVLDAAWSLYSGMVPGVIGGRWAREDVAIDVVRLALRAGAQVLHGRLERVDTARRAVQLVDGRAIDYDRLSINVGCESAGSEQPGVVEHAATVRPLGAFLERVRSGARGRVVVVGGGAAGVELAFALRHRPGVDSVHLVSASRTLMPDRPPAVAVKLARAAVAAGVVHVGGRRAVAAEPRQLVLEGGDRLPFDLLVWAGGARPHRAIAASDLAGGAGVVPTRSTLQVVGHDDVFAAGDCAGLVGRPLLPRAGVYAVRQGPILAANLRAAVTAGPLAEFIPQSDFLRLVDLGDGTALASRGAWSYHGRAALRLKDWIDRRFVERYR
ncbi:MAG: FAD-dependent oxidoreductase [Vicinamibacteria bacterium]|nr:FAD-dependent oxidoreductase [Vicinamibacteria bacterium]